MAPSDSLVLHVSEANDMAESGHRICLFYPLLFFDRLIICVFSAAFITIASNYPFMPGIEFSVVVCFVSCPF